MNSNNHFTNSAQNTQPMGDKEYLNDSITMQKYMSSTYNTMESECANPQLRNDALSILKDEQMIQADMFSEMQRKGWYQIQCAEQPKVEQAKQKYSSSMPSVQ